MMRSCILALCYVFLVQSFVWADEPDKSGFVAMFDGKTLDGWEVVPRSAASAWNVCDGKIVGTGIHGRCDLSYSKNKQIADFEMRFRYRFPEEDNGEPNNLFALPA